MSEPIFRPKWRSAAVEFPAIGEPVSVPSPMGQGLEGKTFRQGRVSVCYERIDLGAGVGGGGGHAGNGLWWVAPAETFRIGDRVLMTPGDAEDLAKWILMMVGKPMKEDKSE